MTSGRFFKLKWRLGAYAVAAVLLASLAWHHGPPTGRFVMNSAWPAPHPQLSELKPVARTVVTGGEVALRGGPVYFDVAPPTPYESVTVEANVLPGAAANLELAARATADGRYQPGASYSRTLAALDWPTVTSGDLTLYQRHRDFVSVDDFLATATTAATLTYPAAVAMTAPPARPSTGERTYALSARGAHRLFARVAAGEHLRLSLLVQDMNRQVGADSARLTVFRAGSETALASVSLPDDGDSTEDWRSTAPRELTLDWAADAAGEYWLAFDASDDLFIRQLSSPLMEFGFLNRLYLGDEVGYDAASAAPATVLVNGRRLEAKAMTADAIQTIAVGGRGLAIPTVGETVASDLSGPTLVDIPHRGLVLTTDGRLTLGGLPSPAVMTMGPQDDETGLDKADINYLLTKTGDVERLANGSYLLRVTYRTKDLALTPTGKYRFVLDVAEGINGSYPVILSVRLTWQRPPMNLVAWLAGLVGRDAQVMTGDEPPRPNLMDFDEQIP
jgi:hypothetical protein